MKEAKDIIDSIKKKRYVQRVIILCFSLFISALVFNFFQRENNLVTGGTSGIALILESTLGLNSSNVITILMLTFLIISFIFLGFEATSGAIISSFAYPFFVSLTQNWPNYLRVDTQDMLLISIFMGVIYGITNGLVFKNGFSNGGTSVISQILYKYFRISISTTSFIINMAIVFIGGLFFGWKVVMYATIVLYINSIVTDKVLIGISKNKYIYIITTEVDEVKTYILNTLKKGVTEFEVKGGFQLKKKKALMTVIPNNDYFKLKEGIKIIDKKAFLIVTDSYQVSGGNK